jgi:SAM-dependent methyltransferase
VAFQVVAQAEEEEEEVVVEVEAAAAEVLVKMSWDSTYRDHQRVWGDRPSALAAFACRYLREAKISGGDIQVLDIGCGYGRDALFIARSLNCYVLGIDNSSAAIEMALKAAGSDSASRAKFQCCDFKQLGGGKFDIMFASNFYHLLRSGERKSLRHIIKKKLKPGGMLFLSTLSPRDPEHFGKGKPVESEINSYVDERFLHFCTQEELEKDFNFLTIKELSEREYFEPRSNGEVHHHILWILVGTS